MMQLSVARHTGRPDEVAGFYRDRIGLTEIGGIRDHDGYDGVFLALPGDISIGVWRLTRGHAICARLHLPRGARAGLRASARCC